MMPSLFLALDLPDGLARELAGLVARSRELEGWRWVRPEGWHLTLRFLGPVSPAVVARSAPSWNRAAAAAEPFSLRLGSGLGCFPPSGLPRILWAAVEEASGADQLPRLALALEREARALGFAPERRPFRAHVTLARARAGARPARPEHAPAAGSAAGPVEDLVLYESRPAEGGARYTALLRFALGRRGAP
jgi:2'-5' RNA ligase